MYMKLGVGVGEIGLGFSRWGIEPQSSGSQPTALEVLLQFGFKYVDDSAILSFLKKIKSCVSICGLLIGVMILKEIF